MGGERTIYILFFCDVLVPLSLRGVELGDFVSGPLESPPVFSSASVFVPLSSVLPLFPLRVSFPLHSGPRFLSTPVLSANVRFSVRRRTMFRASAGFSGTFNGERNTRWNLNETQLGYSYHPIPRLFAIARRNSCLFSARRNSGVADAQRGSFRSSVRRAGNRKSEFTPLFLVPLGHVRTAMGEPSALCAPELFFIILSTAGS